MTAPHGYDPSAFPPFAVTADVVALTKQAGRPLVVLVERANEPFARRWALPGGFVDVDEDLPEAARRELAEETGIEVATSDLRQVGAYGSPGRDPRMRVVTVAFAVSIEDTGGVVAGSDAAAVGLWPVEDVLGDPGLLAFDHHQILGDAMNALSRADSDG